MLGNTTMVTIAAPSRTPPACPAPTGREGLITVIPNTDQIRCTYTIIMTAAIGRGRVRDQPIEGTVRRTRYNDSPMKYVSLREYI